MLDNREFHVPVVTPLVSIVYHLRLQILCDTFMSFHSSQCIISQNILIPLSFQMQEMEIALEMREWGNVYRLVGCLFDGHY